ncbi:MAG: HalOD1 output domain-containing protein [Halovenus sp.]
MSSERATFHCECTPVVDARYGGNNRPPAEAILEALSEAARVDIVELPPLYEFVDPDALEDLFGGQDGRAGGDALFRFTVEDWNVFVRDDGRIRVCDATQCTDPEPVFEASKA